MASATQDDSMELSEEKGGSSGSTVRKRVRVALASMNPPESLDGLKMLIQWKMKDVAENVVFIHLPYNVCDLNKADLSDVDVLLLCHHIHNRRFSITDVTDSLYDNFLKRASKYLGKSKIGVVVYGFSAEDVTPLRLEAKMDAFRAHQPTTFKFSSLALIGAQLEESKIELTAQQVNDMREFFIKASDPSLIEQMFVWVYRCFYGFCSC